MRLALLIALLVGTATTQASECAWDAAFVSAAAKPLPAARFVGIGRSTPMSSIVKQLGPAARDVGSGLYVLQWDVSDGRTFTASTANACSKPVSIGFQRGPTKQSDTLFVRP
jgi:hypothetical protein